MGKFDQYAFTAQPSFDEAANVVVVHHSHCGATSFTADGIIDAYRHEHHLDISSLYQRSSICIADYEAC